MDQTAEEAMDSQRGVWCFVGSRPPRRLGLFTWLGTATAENGDEPPLVAVKSARQCGCGVARVCLVAMFWHW